MRRIGLAVFAISCALSGCKKDDAMKEVAFLAAGTLRACLNAPSVTTGLSSRLEIYKSNCSHPADFDFYIRQFSPDIPLSEHRSGKSEVGSMVVSGRLIQIGVMRTTFSTRTAFDATGNRSLYDFTEYRVVLKEDREIVGQSEVSLTEAFERATSRCRTGP